MHKIIKISGKQGSGKSKLIESLMAKAQMHGFNNAFVFNFADELKKMQTFVLNRAQVIHPSFVAPDKDGDLLQLLGGHFRRKYGQDFWVAITQNAVQKHIELFGNRKFLIIIGDCRMTNEILAFEGATTVRLDAPETVRKARTHSWRENTGDESEIGLDLYGPWDFRFNTDPESIGHKSADEIAAEVLERIKP